MRLRSSSMPSPSVAEHRIGSRLSGLKAATALERSERSRAVAAFKPLNLEPILCSATDGEGIDELRRRILKLAR